MKRITILTILCLLIAVPCFAQEQLAWMNPAVLGSGGSAVVLTDSCTDGLLFSWHGENTDVAKGGIAGGVNNGCVVTGADGTGAPNSTVAIDTDGTPAPTDGIATISAPTGADYYSFTWSSGDIIANGSGTIDLWVNYTTIVTNGGIYRLYVDTSNYIRIYVNATPALIIGHAAGGTVRTATSSLTISTGTWYHVIAKWDTTAHGSDYLQICVDTTSGTSNCGTGTTALGSWSGTSGSIQVGEYSNFGGNLNVDNIKVYSTWK